MMSIGTTETPLHINRDAAANTATCEPYDVAMTVTGWQVYRAFFQDFPSWNGQEFKGNFLVINETFFYLISEA